MAIRDDSRDQVWRPGSAWYKEVPSERQEHEAHKFVNAVRYEINQARAAGHIIEPYIEERIILAIREAA